MNAIIFGQTNTVLIEIAFSLFLFSKLSPIYEAKIYVPSG